MEKELIRALSAVLEERQLAENEWEEGYEERDVAFVLSAFQKALAQVGASGSLVMVWSDFEEPYGFCGDSELWMVRESENGLKGAPVSTPLLEAGDVASFAKDAAAFSLGELPLREIAFSRFEEWNAR